MKKHMERDTILYVGNNFSLGYNFKLLRTNPELIDKKINEATRIFYKVGDSLNTWVDYKKAMENNLGSHSERLEKALKNPNMVLSKDLIEIPSSLYTDVYGDQYFIEPNDGKSLDKFWHERIDYYIEKPEISAKIRPINWTKNDAIDLPVYEIDLSVTFAQDISDSIITMNNLFLEYETISEREVLFRNVRTWSTDVTPLDKLDETSFHYDYEVAVYKWENIGIDEKVRPIYIDGRILTFKEPVNAHGLLTYNGLLYSYELIKEKETDTTSTKIALSLNEFDFEIFDELVLNQFQLIKLGLKERIPNMEVKKYEAMGINNIMKNEVEFPKKVKDAMVIFNHLNFAYHLQDAYTVKVPVGINGVCQGLDDDTPVKAIYFFTGSKDYNSAGYIEEKEDEFENLTPNMIKRDSERYLNDYQDNLEFLNENISLYSKYKPLNDSIRLFINGVRYDKDVHFKYDKKSKAIIWTFTKEVGGFDLNSSYKYTAVYDLSFYENNILDVKSFIKQYKTELKQKNLGF